MNLFARFSRPFSRLSLAGVVVTGMLLLLIMQLSWWLIFFEIRNEEYQSALRENDSLREALANEGRPADLPGGVDPRAGLVRAEDGRFVTDPASIAERERRHARRQFMLISETLFLIAVLVYGHYRIIRALRREWRLVRDRNNLVQSVTHELKTPLAAALLHLQTLVKHELDEERRREILEDGIADLKGLEEQLNNLLTGSALLRGREIRPGAGRRTADAARELRTTVARLAPLARGRSVQVTVEAPEQLPVRLEADLLDRVFGNLLKNAIEHSPEGGRVLVRLERQPVRRRFCVMTVSDEGPGVAAGERENIFQPLYRVEGAGQGGSGMGLYIVREILNAAGGSVRVVAGRPAEPGGLTVEARLPRA